MSPAPLNRLQELGITVDAGDASERFLALFPDFETCRYATPSEFVARLWSARTEEDAANRGVNGLLLEYALATLLLREGVRRLRMGAAISHVPNILFDIVVFTAHAPVVLSVKTTLRERYKQADLEAFALKNVHRKARSYLVTMDERAAATLAAKIAAGDTLGLDAVMVANGPQFDALIRTLAAEATDEPPPAPMVSEGRVVASSRQESAKSKTS